jgi:hypothetical protein
MISLGGQRLGDDIVEKASVVTHQQQRPVAVLQPLFELVRYTKHRCDVLVRYYWPEINAFACVLIEKRTLYGNEVRSFVRESLDTRRGHLMSW